MPALSPMYRITLACSQVAPNQITIAENVKGSAFRCPLCGRMLVYLAQQNKLGAHGAGDASIKHSLRSAQEINEAPGMSKRTP